MNRDDPVAGLSLSKVSVYNTSESDARHMDIAVLLGAVQGVTEWLPISSEGAVAVAYSLLRDTSLSEAVAYALWLHLGTAFSALAAFRGQVLCLIKEATSSPLAPSPLLRFLVAATLISAAIAAPLLLLLDELSERTGASAMVVVGVLLLFTGAVQLRGRSNGARELTEVSLKDALLCGIFQGVSVLPGLSRSGLTVTVLLARRLNRQESLTLSYLLSIPAGLGAALFAYSRDNALMEMEGIVASVVAFLVGLFSIRVLLRLAERINLAPFVLSVGALMIAGAALALAQV